MLINDNWYFYTKDNPEKKILVNLPYDAMLRENRGIESEGGDKIGFFMGNDYFYEKEIEIDSLENKTIYLEFEGIYHNAIIYINDEIAYERSYGYSDFVFDATNYLKVGKNIIKVFAQNSDQPNSRFYSGAGIYRNVHLFSLQNPHIFKKSLKIKTIDYKQKEVKVTYNFSSSSSSTIQVCDLQNHILFERNVEEKLSVEETFKLPDCELWDLQNPNLYILKVSNNINCEELRFGIRQIEIDTEKGLLLNGKRTVLYGCCIHSDNGMFGAESYKEVEYRKILQIKELGYNSIRSAHNPIANDFLDAADELGLLVLDEFTDCWFIRKNKHDYANYFNRNYKKDLFDMVEKDYSHPSVIMYSIGNEVCETAFKRGIELTKEMTDYLHSLDDTRSVTCGINVFFNGISHTFFAQYSDKKADKENLNKQKIKSSSDIFNKIGDAVGGKFMENGAKIWLVDKYTKDAFANLDIAGYNYGLLRYEKDLKKYPNRIILGTETFVFDAAKFMRLSEKYPRIIGDFVWAGLDYLGEAGFGAESNKKEFPYLEDRTGWLTDGGARKDILGCNKSEGDYTQVVFGKKTIDIGVVSPKDIIDGCKRAGWRFNHAINSYSFAGYENKKIEIYVYCASPFVELYQNGKLLKSAKIDENKCFIKVNAKYKPGSLKALALDENKNKIGDIELKSANSETKISVYQEEIVSRKMFEYIHFEVTDSDGILKPLEEKEIEILEVVNGKLERFGNASPYNKDGYLKNKVKTFHGHAMCIVRRSSNEKIEIKYKIENKIFTFNLK